MNTLEYQLLYTKHHKDGSFCTIIICVQYSNSPMTIPFIQDPNLAITMSEDVQVPNDEYLDRYVTLRVAHAPGMPGTFSPPPRVSGPNMQHGTCATQVPWCMPGSLTSGFLWSRWRGKHSRHSGACATRYFTYLVRGPWWSIGRYSADYKNRYNSFNSLSMI